MGAGAGAVTGHKNSQEGPSSSCSRRVSSSPAPSDSSDQNHSRGQGKRSAGAGPTTQTVPRPGQKSRPSSDMSCELCSVNFTFFKRKKFCVECQRYFCSSCLPKPPCSAPPGRQCSKCRLLLSGHFTRNDLEDYKVKDIRCFLKVKNISMAGCKEKHDLIELVLSNFCTQPGHRGMVGDESEHELLVRQMTAHMRNVSFVHEEESSSPGSLSSSTNSPHQQQQNAHSVSAPPSSSSSSTAAANAFASSSTSPSSSSSAAAAHSSASSTTTATAAAGAANAAPSSNSQAGGGESSQGESQTGEEEEDLGERMQGFSRLRELLEVMERLHETLASTQEEEEEIPAAPAVRRTQLDDIASLEDVDSLTIRQLKELLVNNFVDYRGCCERTDLVEKVKNLWKDHQENVSIAQEIQQEEEAELGAAYTTSKPEDDVTKPKTEDICVVEKGKDTASDNTEMEQSSNLQNSLSSDLLKSKSGEDLFNAATASSSSTNKEIPAATTLTEPTPATSVAEMTTLPSGTAAVAAAGGPDSSSPSRRARNQHDSLCHICMDSLVDCILLECGHMVTCTQCGKRLANCPICRQYISRVVRVFRS